MTLTQDQLRRKRTRKNIKRKWAQAIARIKRETLRSVRFIQVGDRIATVPVGGNTKGKITHLNKALDSAIERRNNAIRNSKKYV